jgi:DNA replication protein DnaC
MDTEKTPIGYFHEHVGRRYRSCTFDSFEVTTDEQSNALNACRAYVDGWHENYCSGKSLCLIGPKGTGKDHLMVAVVHEIYRRAKRECVHCHYRDGLTLFAEFRDAISQRAEVDEDRLVERYSTVPLLALSDPVPPKGMLSEYEMRMFLRIVDRRYRDMKPIATTINVASRAEADERMGSQAADRLFDDAIVVKCNWRSYRQNA